MPQPQSQAAKLPDWFNDWARDLFVGKRSRLPKKRPGIDALEPRLLLSGDPLTAIAMNFATNDATLRVVEVEYNRGTTDEPDNVKEKRLQLIQGIDASPTTANVTAEYRIVSIDGQKRVVTGAWNQTSTIIDVFNITGNANNNNLNIDQSILSLHDAVQFNVSLGTGVDGIKGPEKGEGLVWSLDSVGAGSGLTGELALLQPTGSITDPDQGDRTLDNRVTYDGGTRDEFLRFSGVDSIAAESARDIVSDRIGGSRSWGLGWNGDSIGLQSGESSFYVTGADGFQASGNTNLSLAGQTRSGIEAGADINAESGELRLYQALDLARLAPQMFDTNGITSFTGTGGADTGRAARGVDFNLLGGYDIFYGTDDLLEWNVTARADGTSPEASVTLDFFEKSETPATPEVADLWIDLAQTAQLFGIDEIRGGDSDDRLVLNYGSGLVVAVKGTEEDAKLEISGGTGVTSGLFRADDIEYLEVRGGNSVLNYETVSYDVSVDFGLRTASGFEEITGFIGVITGGGADTIIAAADTVLIQTGGGADTITLTRFTSAVTIDAGTGVDTLRGDTDARSNRVTYVDDNDPITPEPDFDADGNLIERDPITDLPINGPYDITNPLGSRFEVRVMDGNGADGIYTTVLANGTAQGGTVNFTDIENIEGQGASGDEDRLVLNLSAGSIVWNVTNVYEGVVVAGGASLAYSSIARAQNAGTRPLTLSYLGNGGTIGTYGGDVIVDLTIEEAAGFSEFKGAVNTLIGTNKNDSLIGNASTTLIQAHDGNDLLGFVNLDGAVAQGGAGVDTVGYRYAQGTVTLLAGSLAQTGASSGNGVATLSGISKAVILAQESLTTAVVINAAAFAGSTVLQGGGGIDTLTSGLGTENGFLASAGSDSLTNTSTSAAYYMTDNASGDWTVSDFETDKIQVANDGVFTDTLVGVFNQIRIGGDENANIMTAAALTRASVVFVGRGGDDILTGGLLADTLSGGEGFDTFVGGGGNDLLREDGFRSYDLINGGLYHDNATDTGYLLSSGPLVPGTNDSFRLEIEGFDGVKLMTAAISFDATDAQVETAIQALRQFDPLVYELTITRDTATVPNITGITMDFVRAYGGRDLGLSMTAYVGGVAQTAVTPVVGTRAGLRESITSIEAVEFNFDLDMPGWANISGWGGTATLTGSGRVDRVIIGANHSVDLGEGDDFVTVTAAGALSPQVTLTGGAGYDRITASGQSTQFLTDTTLSFATTGDAQKVNHAGFEDFVLIGTGGADELNASGLLSGALTLGTLVSTLNNGAGLPIRALDNDAMSVVNRDANGDPLAAVSFDTGEKAFDLKVFHPDGGEPSYVDLTSDVVTMADVVAAFNKPETGLTATITNGELVITSTRTGAGDLRFEGVEVTDATSKGNSGTVQNVYIDTSMLEALGLSDVPFVGATVTSSMGSGISVMIDGGAGADIIVGSAGSDLFIAGDGDDTITGGAGKDHLILNRDGVGGDFVFTATTATVGGTLAATFSGVEVIEARGNSTAQSVNAELLTGQFIYRTGGGADTITKSRGADTIIVEQATAAIVMPTINAAAGATTAHNADDRVFIGASGTIGDLSVYTSGITDPITFGALPERMDELRVTRADDSQTVELVLSAGATTYGAGVFTIKAETIHVQSDVVQSGGSSSTNRLIFETANFSMDRGTRIASNGDVFFVGRTEDRRWTSGFYQIQALDINYTFGAADSGAGIADVEGRNIRIDLRAGKLPAEAVSTGDNAAEPSFLDTLTGIGRTLLDLLEGFSLISANSRIVSTINLTATEHSSFTTTGTGDHGDFDIRVITEGVNYAKPIAILAGLAFGLSEAYHTVQIDSFLTITGDMDLRSVADMNNSVKGDSGGLAGFGIGIGVTVNLIENHVTVAAKTGSTVGGNMKVSADTIERIQTEAGAATGEDGVFTLAIAVEVGVNNTSARVSGLDLTVGGNLVVQATSNKLSLEKKIGFILPYQTQGVAASAATGTVSGGNYIDDAVSGLLPFGAAGSIAISKLAAKANPSKIATWLNDKLEAAPVRPETQIAGAISVLVDNDDVDASLGAEGATASLIKVGGTTNLIGSAAARPKMTTTALASNEGSDTGQTDTGASMAINVGVMNVTADATVEENTTLRARGAVTITATAENKIDPLGLWGANLVGLVRNSTDAPAHKVNPDVKKGGTAIDTGVADVTAGDTVAIDGGRYAAVNTRSDVTLFGENFSNTAEWTDVTSSTTAGSTTFTVGRATVESGGAVVADGVVDIGAGDLVEVGGKRYKAELGRLSVDLASENFTDTTEWAEITAGSTAMNVIGTAATYVDDNFGLAANLFDVWGQSFGRGKVNGIALSLSVLDLDFEAKATVKDGAKIVVTADGEDNGTIGTGHDVNISASAQNDMIALNGNFAPFGPTSGDSANPERNKGFKVGMKDFYKKYGDSIKGSKAVQNPAGDGETENAYGAAVSVLLERTYATTHIGDATIIANDLTASSNATHLNFGLAAAGGKGSELSLNGSWNHTTIDSSAITKIGSGANITLTGNLDLDATELTTIVQFAGAVSVSNKAAIGISGVTVLSDRRADVLISGGAGGGSIAVDGEMTMDAEVKGAIITGAIAASVAKPAPPSATGGGGSSPSSSGAASSGGVGGKTPSGVSKGASASKSGFAISGSAIGFEEDIFVNTDIEGLASLTAGSLFMRAEDTANRILVAGSGAMTTTQTGVGIAGAFVVIDSQKEIGSRISTTDATALLLSAGTLTMRARDNSGYFSLAVGVAVSKGSKGVGVSGSVTVTVARTEIEAGLYGKAARQITLGAATAVDISGRNDALWLHISGAGAYGSAAGVGVSVGVAVIASLVETHLDHVVMGAAVQAASLSVQAVNSIHLINLSFGAAVSTGGGAKGAGVGMVAINVYDASTVVESTGSTVAVGGTGAIGLTAFDESTIVATAGGLAVSTGKVAVGVAVAVNIAGQATNDANQSRGTEVLLTGSSLTSGSGLLSAIAVTDLTMVSVAVGVAVAKSFAFAGSAAVNRNDIGTKVIIDEASTLAGSGSMRAEAVNVSDHTTIAGGVGVSFDPSSGGAGGAGIAITLVDTPVTTQVNGTVTMSGDASIIARANQVNVTIAIGGAGSGGFALGGSVAVTTIDGDVTTSVAPISAKTWAVRDLTVAAQESSTVVSIAGAVGIGLSYGGVGAAFGVITSDRSILSSVNGPVTVNASGHVQITAGSRKPVGAGTDNAFLDSAISGLGDDAFSQDDNTLDKSDLRSQMINITAAVGGSKMVGVGFNLAYTEVDREIKASVSGGAIFNLTNNSTSAIIDGEAGQTKGLLVKADDASGIVVVSVGAAAAVGPDQSIAIAVAGSVAYSNIDSSVIAEIGDATVNLANQADLGVLARNDSTIISVAIGAAAAVGGTTVGGAVGFSAAVNKISGEVGARLSGNVTATGGGKVNNIYVDAENTAFIVAVSIAAAVAATTGTVGFAGGGAGSGNIIAGATYAVVSDATILNADAMSVNAMGDATITAVVVGIAVSVAGGSGTSLSFSIGIAAASNETQGLDSNIVGLPAGSGYVVAARVADSSVILDGALAVDARSENTITAVVLAASVAVALTGGFGLSGAGAGAGAGNYGSSRVLAEIVGSTGNDRTVANGIHVGAVNLSKITAVIGSAAVAVAVGGGSNIAFSIAIGISINSIDASTVARISGFTAAGALNAKGGALEVLASTDTGSDKLEINATSVAASVAVAAGGATGIALAGGGANSINDITGQTIAELTNVGAGSAGSVTVKAQNKIDIDANVVVIAAGVGAAGAGGAGAAAIGGVYVSNEVGSSTDAFDVIARVANARMTVSGDMIVKAQNDTRIFANGDAVSAAVAVSSDVAGALSGAGAGVYNDVYVNTLAEVSRSAGPINGLNTMLTVRSLSVEAKDNADIEAIAVGAAVAVGVGGLAVGVAISIGVAIAENTVSNSVLAEIKDGVLGPDQMVVAGVAGVPGVPAVISQPPSGPAIVITPAVPAIAPTGGNITVVADNDATVFGTAVAASVAASFGLFGGIAISGAGAAVHNAVDNNSEAFITNARLTAYNGNIDAIATNDTILKARIVTVAAAVSGGIIAGAGSIGVSILSSSVGGENATDRSHRTRAVVTNSDLTAGRNVTIKADAKEEHRVEAATASVAVAIGLGGSVAGAGIGVSVTNYSTVEAISTNSLIYAGGDISVLSFAETLVNDAVPNGSGSTMVGVAMSVGLGAVAINVSILRVEVENTSHAIVSHSNRAGRVLEAGGNINVKADSISRLLDLNGVGVAISGGGISATGGGLEITLTVNNSVTSMIDLSGKDSEVIATSGTVNVEAKDTAEFDSNVANINLAIAPIGLAVGAAVMKTRHSSTVASTIKDARVTAKIVRATALSDVDIKDVGATGVSVGTIAVEVNVARAEAAGTVTTTIDNAVLVGEQSVDVTAYADLFLRSSTLGVSAGLGAIGSMTAFAEAGLGADNDNGADDANADSLVVFKNNVEIISRQLNVLADLDNDMFVDTTAGGGGGFVAIGAVSHVRDNTTSEITVGSNTKITADGVNMAARAERELDGNADANSFAAASGAGASLKLTALGDARITFATGTGENDRTKIIGESVEIVTYNKVYKEAVVSTNGQPAKLSSNVSSGSGNLLGLTVIGTDARIGIVSDSLTDRSRSAVDLGDIWIKGEGTFKNPSRVVVRALTDHSVADAVEVFALSGLGGLAVSTTDQTIDAETDVSMDGAFIDNLGGDVKVETRANIRNTADGAVFQSGLVSANLGIDVKAITNSATTIDLDNTDIEGLRVELSAGKANNTVNSMVQRTAANGSLVSLGISLGVAVQTNTTNRVAAVDIDGATRINSAGNLVISAERGLFQTSDDGLVLVLAVPPYGYNVANQGSHGGSANVNIDAAARLRAGVNYQTIYEVAYVGNGALNRWNGPDIAINGDGSARQLDNTVTRGENDSPAKVGTGTEKEIILGVDNNQDYVIQYWDADTLATDLYAGDIVQLEQVNIDSNGAKGTGGNYYRFLGEGPMAIVTQATDYTNTALWQNLGASPSTFIVDQAFGSNANAYMRAAFYQQIAVIRPGKMDNPTISVGQLSTLLATQYQQIREWMREHNSNAEALVRYAAQLEQIETQMIALGLTPPSGSGDDAIIEENLPAVFLEIPNIVAAPGSIFIQAENAASASTLVDNATTTGPTLLAHKDVQIDVRSDVFMMHRVNDVVIANTKVARFSELTGDYTEFYPGNIYANDRLIGGGSSSNGSAQINVTINAVNRSTYEYVNEIAVAYAANNSYRAIPGDETSALISATLPDLPPDLYLLGSIVNDLGNVSVQTTVGAIRLTGVILAKTVNIKSGGDFVVSTDWYHAGANPRTNTGLGSGEYSNNSKFIGFLTPSNFSTKGAVNTLTATAASTFGQAYLTERNLAASQSAVVANGVVSIVATNVNINGLIQSGVQSASMTIPETFTAPSTSRSLVGTNDEGLFGIVYGNINGTQVPLSGRWDANEKAIILDDIDFAGGRIEITGNVFSTGNGSLKVASGYADVTIRNYSNVKLITNVINTSRDRQGVIQITDTLDIPAKNPATPDAYVAKRTVFTEDAGGILVEAFRGDITRDSEGNFEGVQFTSLAAAQRVNALTTTYTPKTGTYYVWTEGQSSVVQEIYTEYWKTFNFIFNFPSGSGTELSRNVEELSDSPLLESEGTQDIAALAAALGIDPTAATNAEIIGRFKNISNVAVELTNGNIVRHDFTPAGGTATTVYYIYSPEDAGTKLEVELSLLFEADGTIDPDKYAGFELYGGTTTFDANKRDFGQYLSTFKNFDQTKREWTEGGGYLKKKTKYRETTTTEGLKKYWDIGLKASHAVNIEFLAGSAIPTVRIESVGEVNLAGDIRTAPDAHVYINGEFSTPSKAFGRNGGSVIATQNVSISGKLQAVRTNGIFDSVLVNFIAEPPVAAQTFAAQAFSSGPGGAPQMLMMMSMAVTPPPTAYMSPVVPAPTDVPYELDIETTVEIRLDLGSNTNSDGFVVVKRAWTTGGLVYISAPQGIFASASTNAADPHIRADRIELQSTQSVVGTADRALRIDTNHLAVNGGFSGAAGLGLNVVEVSGDLHLVRPENIRTSFVRTDQQAEGELGSISVGSLEGVVRLTALSGSILDYNFETDGAMTDARIAAYQSRLGLSEGNRTIAGQQIDNRVRSDYQVYNDYWNLIRTPNPGLQ